MCIRDSLKSGFMAREDLVRRCPTWVGDEGRTVESVSSPYSGFQPKLVKVAIQVGDNVEGLGRKEARGFTTSSVTRLHRAPNCTFRDRVLFRCVGSSIFPADSNIVANVNEIL